jgi:hypothetical protein
MNSSLEITFIKLIEIKELLAWTRSPQSQIVCIISIETGNRCIISHGNNSLISISLMKVISKELFMKDKMPSISPVFCIQMTQLMLEKSLDLNNNTSFVQLPFMILLEDTKRFMMINSRSLQV